MKVKCLATNLTAQQKTVLGLMDNQEILSIHILLGKLIRFWL